MDSEPFQWRDERDIPPRREGMPSWQEQMQDEGEFTPDEVADFLDIHHEDCLPLFRLSELNGVPPADREWILPGFIPAREVTLFTGPGGAGKSLFAQQLATCIAAQIPFLRLPTIGLCIEDEDSVLYVTCEDDENELHRRQRNIMAALGKERRDLGRRLYISSLRGRIGNELARFEHDGTLHQTETYAKLFRTVMETGAQFVVLDNVGHLFAGNENDRGQVTRFVNLLYSIVRQLGVTILLVAHPNKSGDAYSGSTAWLNAVRSQIEINRLRDSQGEVIDADSRVLTVGKANYARSDTELHFRWHQWAYVIPDDLPPNILAQIADTARNTADNTRFKKCLAICIEQKRAVSHVPGTNYAPKIFAGMTEGKGVTVKAYAAAMERLLHLKEIEINADLWQDSSRHWKRGLRLLE